MQRKGQPANKSKGSRSSSRRPSKTGPGLHNFQKLKKLGQGSYGHVYLVKDNRDGKSCVIKEINLCQLDPKSRKEAIKEVQFMAFLDHPCIVAYKEYFTREVPGSKRAEVLYIVMEFADGGDVEKELKRYKKKKTLLNESKVVAWFVQLCLAIKHIHDRKIIHRDLKCENLFLTSKGRLKVGDFGVSRGLDNTLMQVKTQVGTPYYISPEVCKHAPYDNKTDMWAMGVILYEMMSLQKPFQGANLQALVNKICGSRPAALPSCYSEELRNCCGSLLSKDPSKRPTVSKLLEMPIFKHRIQDCIPKEVIKDEFSHTMLHNIPPPTLKDPIPKTAAGSGVSKAAVEKVAQAKAVAEAKLAAKTEEKKRTVASIQAASVIAVTSAPSATAKKAGVKQFLNDIQAIRAKRRELVKATSSSDQENAPISSQNSPKPRTRSPLKYNNMPLTSPVVEKIVRRQPLRAVNHPNLPSSKARVPGSPEKSVHCSNLNSQAQNTHKGHKVDKVIPSCASAPVSPGRASSQTSPPRRRLDPRVVAAQRAMSTQELVKYARANKMRARKPAVLLSPASNFVNLRKNRNKSGANSSARAIVGGWQ